MNKRQKKKNKTKNKVVLITFEERVWRPYEGETMEEWIERSATRS